MRLLCLLAVLVLAAGCLQSTPPLAQLSGAAAVDPAEAAPTLLPPTRVPVAQVRLHETVDSRLADFPPTAAKEVLPDRDVNVTYNGIHNVLDEFARPVPAYIFRYAARELSVDHDRQGNPSHAEYVTREIEYPFATADGRLLGIVDVAAGGRSFMPPGSHYFYIGSQAFAFMAMVATGGDLSKEMALATQANHTYYIHFEPTDLHPLPGECTAYQPQFRVDPPLPAPKSHPERPAKPVAPENVTHSIVCFDDQLIPLWSYDGSTGQGAETTTRLGDSFALPPLQGEVLPPVHYEARGWDKVTSLSPAAAPSLTPPSSKSGDWADMVAARVKALDTDPSYHLFRTGPPAGSPGPAAVDFAWLNLPAFSPLGAPVPAGLQTDSLLQLASGDASYFGQVMRASGSPTGELLLAQPTLNPIGGGSWGPADPPNMPAAGDVQAQLAPVLPGNGMVIFWNFAFPSGETRGYWMVFQFCSPDGGGFALIDALDGHAEYASRLPPGGPGCPNLAASELPAPPHATDFARRVMHPKPWQPLFG